MTSSSNKPVTPATQEIQIWALLKSSDLIVMQRDFVKITVAVLKSKGRNKQFTHQKTDKTGSKAHQGTVVPEQQTKRKNRSNGIKDATTHRCHHFSVVKELRGGVRKKKHLFSLFCMAVCSTGTRWSGSFIVFLFFRSSHLNH